MEPSITSRAGSGKVAPRVERNRVLQDERGGMKKAARFGEGFSLWKRPRIKREKADERQRKKASIRACGFAIKEEEEEKEDNEYDREMRTMQRRKQERPRRRREAASSSENTERRTRGFVNAPLTTVLGFIHSSTSARLIVRRFTLSSSLT